jgi:hypothetical protein
MEENFLDIMVPSAEQCVVNGDALLLMILAICVDIVVVRSKREGAPIFVNIAFICANPAIN